MGQVAHVITGSEGELLAWSETLPAMLGLEPTTMPATTRAWLNCVHPHDHERFREKAMAAAKCGRRVHIGYRLRSGAGKWLDVRAVMEPLDEEKYAAPDGLWLSTLRNITAVKRTKQAPRTVHAHARPTPGKRQSASRRSR
jgi:PAS domain S-box-containing protein